jgi:hypothetical protein
MKSYTVRLIEIISLGLCIGMLGGFILWYVQELGHLIELKQQHHLQELEYQDDEILGHEGKDVLGPEGNHEDHLESYVIKGNSGPDNAVTFVYRYELGI